MMIVMEMVRGRRSKSVYRKYGIVHVSINLLVQFDFLGTLYEMI